MVLIEIVGSSIRQVESVQVPSDPLRDPELLRRFLVGKTGQGEGSLELYFGSGGPGPGLIRRVERQVRALAAPPGPRLAQQRYGEKVKINDADKPFTPLILYLLLWLGHNPDTGALARFLRAGPLEDYELLIGSERWPFGLLGRARDRCAGVLAPEFVSNRFIHDALDLARFLLDWSESRCVHNLRPIEQDPSYVRYRCDLAGCRLEITLGTDALIQVPTARCEGCGQPIYRESLSERGRRGLWCSDACKQRAYRERVVAA